MTIERPLTLPYSIVDPHSPVPLYHQIYLDLRQMIQNGVIPPGGMLPPEMEICQAYSVGRQSLGQLCALAAQGKQSCYNQNMLTSHQATLPALRAMLGDILADQPDVLAAYLFGSVARRQANTLSDLDIAVLLPAWTQKPCSKSSWPLSVRWKTPLGEKSRWLS